MKQIIACTLAIVLSWCSTLHAHNEQAYDALVNGRLQEAVAATSGVPDKLWKSNPGASIWMALIFLHENRNLEEAERIITEFCGNPLTEYLGKPVPQSRTEGLFRIYLTKATRDRLSTKAKETIEDFAWLLLTKHHRGITPADADKPFWEFSSSENHYVNDRRRYTQALQIVGMAERYGPKHLFEGKSIEFHSKAWVDFWIRYFESRADEGTDMEIAHPSSYGACTIGVYYDLYDFTDSPRLRELAGNFLTLFWADVATEFNPLTGQRAVASTRNPFYDGQRQYWAESLLFCYGWHEGGYRDASFGMLPFVLSSYRPPEILRGIARDPNRGPFLSTSRRAALIADKEAPGVIVFDENGDSHFRRDVFHTPDYTLATMTLDPSKEYNGVSTLAQVMGATFATDPKSRIVVTGTGFYCQRAISGITGTAVSIIARDPNAQVGRGRFMSDGTRVFISNGPLWDNRIEDASGWFFTHAGDAYAALRVADGGYQISSRTFIWPDRKLQEVEERHGHHLELTDMWAPIVIQMGRASDFKSFEAFCNSVRDNRFEYADGKLTYTSEAGETFEVWAKAAHLPTINGEAVNLNPTKTFDSPFLSMEHGSNKAVISYPGYDDVVLEF